ncbi:hypothetical protein ACLPJK_26055 [Pseudomonas aeruginosa]|uniref:hypothetical protein n=1 Tax=Pseudomonas aeruginosa TaxID=287 RepID=UPI003D283E00
MINSPYQATSCKRYSAQVRKVIDQLRALYTSNAEGVFTLQFPGVVLLTPLASGVDVFTQPITVADYTDPDDARSLPGPVIIDARGWLRVVKDAGSRYGVAFNVATHSEGEMHVLRGRLQHLWQSEGFNRLDLRHIGELPGSVFSKWIARTLVHARGLDEAESLATQLICAYYYYSLFISEKELAGHNRDKIIKLTADTVRVPFETAQNNLSELGYLSGVDDLTAALRQGIGSARASDINNVLLYNALGNSWFGSNKTELISVALEHPPTWVAMIYTAVNDRGYRKSQIGALALNSSRKQSDKLLTRNVESLVREFHSYPAAP